MRVPYLRRNRPSPPEAEPGIPAFWTWWRDQGAARCAAALEAGQAETLVAELSARVDGVRPGLAWEFAQGSGSRHVLVVTAAGVPELRAVARRWLRAAPLADATWEFADMRPAAPGLGWRLSMDGRDVDAASVRVAWTVDEARARVDVRVHHPAWAGLSPDQRGQLTLLLLDGTLGEAAVETWIGTIDSQPEPLAGPSGDLAALAAAVRDLVGRCTADDGGPAWRLLRARTPSGQVVMAAVQVPLAPATAAHLDAHVRIELPYPPGDERGLPGDAALEDLRVAEDGVRALLGDDGAVVAHESSGGLRTLHAYVDSGTDAVDRVRAAVPAWPHGRPRTTVTPDPAWRAVRHLAG